MLFRANLPNDFLDKPLDDPKFIEELYKFLRPYMEKRLSFENAETIEDYVQDTIMYILKRLSNITEEEKKDIILEKYIYNRARSFVSNKLKLRKLRYKISKKCGYEYISKIIAEAKEEPQFLDSYLLENIVKQYSLTGRDHDIVKALANNKLITLGYISTVIDIDKDKLDPLEYFEHLSITVTDEYLMEIIGGEILK